MRSGLDQDEFLRQVRVFGESLDRVGDFNAIHKLWRETNLPYTYHSKDPLSPDYRDEVLGLYRRMTSLDYAVANEMTSTKQSAEQFETGFPWSSRNLQAVAEEYLKVAQALSAIHACKPGTNRIIEFGSGWGNLAIPLAKAGQEVAVVDIDRGFLDRLMRVAARENVDAQPLHGDFVEVARAVETRYDFAVFQASFHHCLNFVELVQALRDNVLTPDGRIIFFSEPIFENYAFPWGLRFDGESLWAITRNQWLELGFDRNFFLDFMHRSGFLMSSIPGIPGLLGEGWLAQRPNPSGIAFEDWTLSREFSDTFHFSHPGTGHGRFCMAESRLPSLKDSPWSTYRLDFHNFGSIPLKVVLQNQESPCLFTIDPNQGYTTEADARHGPLTIQSEVFIPREQGMSDDGRELGVALKRVTFVS